MFNPFFFFCQILLGRDATSDQKRHLSEGIRRVSQVCRLAKEKGVMVMVDAEYTYLNAGLNLFTLAMMTECNHTQRLPLICYTYQNYLKVSFFQFLE